MVVGGADAEHFVVLNGDIGGARVVVDVDDRGLELDLTEVAVVLLVAEEDVPVSVQRAGLGGLDSEAADTALDDVVVPLAVFLGAVGLEAVV